MSQAPFWIRCLPAVLRAKIENRHNLQNILSNTGWLFADKILRMGMGLLVGVWIARYLGPSQFGLFNYATAIVALFTSIATLGLNNIVVRDLIRNPDDAGTTLGTTLMLQVIGSLIATASAVIAVSLMRPNDISVRTMVAIVGSAMIFKSSDAIRYWFEARVQSKYTVLVENTAFLIFATIKVGLILGAASLLAFVWTVIAEAALVAALLLLVYMQQGNKISEWKFNGSRAKALLNDSWPLILSGLAAILYMRIDQIMLGQIFSDEAVGIYSAAVRISEVWYFIPTAIVASVFPAIIDAREKDQELYQARLSNLLQLMSLLAISLAIPISFLAPWIMKILYGEGYSESAQILVIHVWTGFFVFSGIASARWFIAENLQKYTFYRAIAGCITSICLNYLLIPKYGPIGSAWASVASQAVASVLFNSINKKTRPLFYLQIRAIFFNKLIFNLGKIR